MRRHMTVNLEFTVHTGIFTILQFTVVVLLSFSQSIRE